MTTKTCSKCGETKDVSEFSKNKRRKGGLQGWCKACERAYRQANKEQIAEKKRAYNQANKEEVAEYHRARYQAKKEQILEQQRAYYQANREKVAERNRAYQQANKEKVADYQRAYRQANKERLAEYQRDYTKKRYAEDPVYAMVLRLRRRLLHALSGQAKPASTMGLVGCSAEKLCAWLEMHFAEGMTWENRSEWHIDHIRPIASFEDPADPECWHWSNLQPMWAEDNMRKGDSWDGVASDGGPE